MSAESAGADSVGSSPGGELPAGSAGVPDRARLFVALDLDGHAREALARWRDGIAASEPGLRPVPLDALHMTLCFLGTCPAGEVDAIAAACAIGCEAPLSGLRLGDALLLPRRHPRVLAAMVEDDAGALARVQSALADALSAGGWYRPEPRPFLAHVTVARVAGDRRSRRISRPAPPLPLDLAETAIVALYRSHLSAAGSRYEVLRVVSLRGGGTAECRPGPLDEVRS